MASKLCCYVPKSSASSDSLNPRYHNVEDEAVPLFVIPFDDSTNSSFQYSTPTSVETFELVLAPRNIAQSNRSSAIKSVSQPRLMEPSKTSEISFGAKISKKLSWQSITANKSDKKELRRASSLQHRKGRRTRRQSLPNQSLDIDVLTGTTISGIGYDSDASLLATPAILERLLQIGSVQSSDGPPNTIQEAPEWLIVEDSATLKSVGNVNRSRSNPNLNRTETLPPRKVFTQSPLISAMESKQDQTAGILDCGLKMPSNVCVQLPARAILEARCPIDGSKRQLPIGCSTSNQQCELAIVPPRMRLSTSPYNSLACFDRMNKRDEYAGSQKIDTVPLYDDNTALITNQDFDNQGEHGGSNSRERESSSSHESIHLYNMRISQHLRSFSGASIMSSEGVFERIYNSSAWPNSIFPFQNDSDPAHQQQENSCCVNFPSPIPLDSVLYKDETCLETLKDEGERRKARETGSGYEHTIQMMASEDLELGVKSMKESVHETSQMTFSGHGISNSRLTFIRPGKSDTAYDGSADDRLTPPTIQPCRRSTISGNHEEAAFVWEKALRDHQKSHIMQPQQRDTSFANESRTQLEAQDVSSFSSYAQATGPFETSTRKARSLSQLPQFKPINTQHSFDRLLTEEFLSNRRISSPNITITDTSAHNDSLRMYLADDHQNKASSPDLLASHLSVPGTESPMAMRNTVEASRSSVESFELYTLASVNNDTRAMPSYQSDAWSRYPSHTREERNASAGKQDNVIARDFAGLERIVRQNDQNSSKGIQLKNRKKFNNIRRRSTILKKKLFTDFPAIIWPNSFGRRSSIATSRSLEYPELELLPSARPFNAKVNFQRQPRLPSLSATCTSASCPIRGDDFNGPKISEAKPEDKCNIQHTQGLSRTHTNISRPQDTPTKASVVHESYTSPSPQSNNSIFDSIHMVRKSRSLRLNSASSTECLRESTVNLFAMLQQNEAAEREKALNAAEVSWE